MKGTGKEIKEKGKGNERKGKEMKGKGLNPTNLVFGGRKT